ncbi:hypothetical protein OSH11_15815 [Kaistia dalseonensis]|uniref:Uncharacterized protein n=1 Tax=Kaistia dalseonensis TaxID=410840 RepID=A0ABU0HBC3_9HYPH|nr:hypothetical protein [Kaistia dalseonensis]MCX5496179.1 hypothetical protein [Kaistia dalseonensis]MDQ0438791.1 hypothetical protein [Kaistia dalseonensis]
MIEPGAIVRREAAAIAKIGAAFASLGIPIDVGAAIRAGISLPDFALLVVADAVAALEGEEISPEVAAFLETAHTD